MIFKVCCSIIITFHHSLLLDFQPSPTFTNNAQSCPQRNGHNMLTVYAGNTLRGEYHCTIDLMFDWFGINCMTANNFCFYLQNRLIQASQTRGQPYSDTSHFSIPWCMTTKLQNNLQSSFTI